MSVKTSQTGRNSRLGNVSRLLSGASLTAVALLALPSAAQAQDANVYWDPNGSTVGSGGSGNWNTTSNSWSRSNNDVLGPWGAWNNDPLNPDNAIFGTTAGTLPVAPITLTQPIIVHNMTFQSVNDWVLNGGTLTLAGTDPTITTIGRTTINSVIAGTAGLIKEGASSLTLTGNNTFSGGIFLNAGTLTASSDAGFGAASNSITIKDNVGVSFSATIGQQINRTVLIGSGSTVTVSGGAGSALYTGSGNVAVAAGHRLTNDASTYTGKTTFNTCSGICTDYFTSVRNLGEASSLGAPTTIANGTISWSPGGQYSDNLVYLGDGDTSNRNWAFGGNRGGNFYNDGTGALILNGDIALSNSASITFNARNADMQLLGVISGTTPVGFTASALGDITLGGNNSFTGRAAIGGGTVFVPVLADAGVNSSLGAGSWIAMGGNGLLSYTGGAVTTNRDWTNAGNNTISNDGSGVLTLTGPVSLLSGTLTFGGSYGGTNIVSGVISDTGGLGSSSGTWVLSGANTRTGAIAVTGGTLRAGSAMAFGTTTGVTVNGGTLDLNGFDLTTPTLSSTTSVGTIALGSATLTVNSSTDSSYGGAITGTGGLTKIGNKILTLTGSSSYSGPTNVNGGTLLLDFTPAGGTTSDIASASSALNISNGATVHIKGANSETDSQSFNGLNILSGANTIRTEVGTGGTLTVDFGTISRTAGMVNFDLVPNASSNVFLLTDNIDGALGGWAMIDNTDYAKVVAGRIVAFDDLDYTDLDNAADWDTLGAGKFVSDDDGDAFSFSGTVDNSVQLAGLHYNTAAPSNVSIGDGNTLGIDGAILVAPIAGNYNQQISGGFITGSASGVLGVQHNGAANGPGTFTINSTIVDNSGPTGFTKGGTGRVTLAGTNSYTGRTTLSGGTLTVNGVTDGGIASGIGASTADPSNLLLQGGTLVIAGGLNQVTDRGFTLEDAGLGVPTIQVDTGRTVEFEGLVTSSNDQGLTKSGGGTLALSNDTNDYTGVTTVSGGILSVDTLADGGMVSGFGASSAASANLALQTGGVLQYTGGNVSSDRGFTLASGSGGIDVDNGATTLTLSGVAVGGGSLVKSGAGTLTLCGANTYTGGTTVTAGTLKACSTSAFGTGAMTVNTDAILELVNNSTTVRGLSGDGNVVLGSGTLTTNGNGSFNGTISGTGGLTVEAGTQTMSGCSNTYTGVTTIDGGVLSVGCLKDGGVASDIGMSGAASSNLIIRDSGILSYTGGTQTTNRGFTLENSWGYVNVSNAGTTLTFTGNVVGPAAGSLVKRGPGTLVLSGTNSYGGHTSIEAGILRAGSATAFGAGTGGLFMGNVAGATLDMNGFDITFQYLTGGGALGGNILTGGGGLTLTYLGGTTQTYAGTISGSGGLTKSGHASFDQVLSNCSNSYTGVTTIAAGTLTVSCLNNGSVNSSIGASSSLATSLVLNGGTLKYNGAGGTTDRLFTLGSSATSKFDASGTGAIGFTNSGAIAFSSPNTAQTIRLGGTNTGDNYLTALITDNGSGKTGLTKLDAGTWRIANSANTYTGIITITGGVLGVDKLSNGGEASSIGMSSNLATNLVIGEGATLRYTGMGDTTDRLFRLDKGTTVIESSGSGAIAFTNTSNMGLLDSGQRTVSLAGSNTGDNVMGVSLINQSATNFTSLAKNGSGKWILTGTNTYTGNTNVNQGTLVIGDGGTTGSIASTNSIVASGATLGFSRANTMTYAGTISGAGSVQQLGTGTTVLTGTNTYTGGTTITQGTLQLGSGGATGAIVGNVANNGTLAFNRSNAYAFAGAIFGSGRVTQIGSGTTTLTGTNSYSGDTTITSGTLQVGNGGNTGSLGTGNVINNAALVFNRSNDIAFGGTISGTGTLTKQGAGMLTLTANNDYTGATTISAGTLQIGNGGPTGSIAGNVLNNGALLFNRSGTLTMGGTIIGGGSVTQAGPGTTILTGANTYAGPTNVNAGTLLINGDQSGATNATLVASGATLGGIGTIGGSVNVADGGVLAAGSNGVGTLTIRGDLTLANASQLNFELGQANVPGGPLNDLINVEGNLTLDGTVNVTQPLGGTFAPGVYRMFNYGGALTDNGMTVGSLPSGTAFVQTALANQVNLVNTAGLVLGFWDGSAGLKNNSVIEGGSGTWRVSGGSNDWTTVNGQVNADYAQDSFAIFQGAPGTVTVDNVGGAVQASGLQFTTDGYILNGGPLTLTGAQALVRIGDGGAGDAGVTTRIDAELTGTAQLVKDLAGTLVLTGTNTYTGGTAVNGGTLRIAGDANLGAAAGGLSFNGGTLNTTADLTSARAVTLAGAGTLLTDAGTTLTLSGAVSGAGALTKDGTGTVVLTGTGGHTGGTTVAAGTLQIGNGGTAGSLSGNVANNGLVTFDRSDAYTFAGVISGTGAVEQAGTGTTILTGNNTYVGGTTITVGTLRLGSGGTSGSIVGDVLNNGVLAFDRSDAVTFAGVISGSGRVDQIGSGITTLTGTNSYAGATNVTAGTLLVNGDQTAATGITSVASGATLGGSGIIGGSVDVAAGATLAAGDITGPGTLTINGDLGLVAGTRLAYDFGQSNVVGGPLNDLTKVGGNLTLDGTIDVAVSPGGDFNTGLYRVISYGGTLIDNGLTLGLMPPGSVVAVQTSVAGQVNLINAAGATLDFWDGGALANKADGVIDGGNGIWQNSTGNDNWTLPSGAVNGAYTDASFAIFAAAPGTVAVDNGLGAVTASGLQFATDGYTITGQDLTLVGPQSVIRVGDGTADGVGYTATIASALIGSSQLVKTDLGTLVLSGTNSHTGGTRINAGTVRIASDASLGDVAGGLSFDGGILNTTANITTARNVDLLGQGTFVTDAGTSLVFTGALSGAGNLIKDGAGTLALNDTSSHTGTTSVRAGNLFVNGDQSAATGLVTVAAGATLGGSGIIGGDVIVEDGGMLAPGNSPGTLTINGALGLSAASLLNYEFGQANVAGGPLNDLVNVGGDLTLDGTINVAVAGGGTFGPGIYRVFNYGGTLTDNGLALGGMPAGSTVAVQTAVAGQVNLVNTAGLLLNFWDGGAGPKNDGSIDGGSGTWRIAGATNNWTEASGAVNADYAQDSFAIFAGAPGTVSVDNGGGNVLASGLQFAVDGYLVDGGALTLTGSNAIVQVGDGSVAGAGYTATIDAELAGTAGLIKTDAGTLVLTGTNSYTGGTAINGGTLRVAGDVNLGDVAGGLSFDGGTLATTADLASARAVTLAGTGTLASGAGTMLTLNGTVSGAGALTKSGSGTLVLTGTNTYAGVTHVTAGTLLVNGNQTGAAGLMSIASAATLGGTGTIGGSVAIADGAILAPGAGAPGTLTIGGGLTLSAGSLLDFEFGQAGIAGGALNDLVNVGGDLTLGGTINVSVPTGGAFDIGVYRVLNYGGALIDNGLTLGSSPAGSTARVQRSIAGQVNLVNTGGLTLSFWDGAAGPKNNGVVNGGTGVWQNAGGNDNWTDAAGSVNGSYSDGTFAVFGGAGGTVTVDNGSGQVTAAGMQFAASGYTIGGAGIILTGPQATVRVGDGSTAGVGFTATIGSALGGAAQLVKTDAGTLVLGGTNTYTGGTAINGGTVQISADANLGAAAGGVTLNSGTLATSASLTSARNIALAGSGTISTAQGTTFTLSGLLSGTGALTKTGAGTLRLTGDNSAFSGRTQVEGTLAVNGSLCGDIDVRAGGRLQGTGTVCTTVNAGTVAPGNSIGTLTVAGSYTGTGGTLEIEAELGGDASPTDRLVVTGGTAGSTTVRVINTGGLGAQTVEGIKIVDVTGGASNGTFALNGDYTFQGSAAVIAGAYGYRLFQGGTSTPTDGDWYLRSALLDGSGQPTGPLYQPGTPIYESYAQTLQTLTALPTMQERVGNRRWGQSPTGEATPVWGRIEASHLRSRAQRSTTAADTQANTWKAQIGVDWTLSEGEDSSMVAGLTAQYGHVDADVSSLFGNGGIDADAYGIGATFTWFGPNGFYADAQGQLNWSRSDLKSNVVGVLARDNHGSGHALSLELGKRAAVVSGLTVTPQIQVAYQHVRFDRFADRFDAAVSSGKADSLRTRWGVSVDYEDVRGLQTASRRSHLYGSFNLEYEWLNGTRVDVSGTPLIRTNDRLWGEIAVGGSIGITDRVTLYGQGSASSSIQNFGDSYDVKGMAGVRFSF